MTLRELLPPAGWMLLIGLTLAAPPRCLAQAPPRQTLPPAGQGAGPAPGQPQGQPIGRPIGGAGPAQPQPRRSPVTLTPAEEASLMALLQLWEQHTSEIANLRCTIDVWENNPVFGKRTHTVGELRYQSPDKGAYEISGTYEAGPDGREMLKQFLGPHWTCDGQSIFDLRHSERKLVEFRLPPGAQGSALSHSPIPFLFGANSNELRGRYFLKETTTPDERANREHWLVAFPRYRHDAANFSKAEVILRYFPFEDRELLLPFGLRLTDPNGKTETSHAFRDYKLNEKKGWLERIRDRPWRPKVPLGYEYVVEQPSAATPEAPEQQKPGFWNPLGLRPRTETR